MRLSPTAQNDARHILDRAARRLLQARLHANTVGAFPRHHDSTIDDSADQVSALVHREVVPVGSRNGDNRRDERAEVA